MRSNPTKASVPETYDLGDGVGVTVQEVTLKPVSSRTTFYYRGVAPKKLSNKNCECSEKYDNFLDVTHANGDTYMHCPKCGCLKAIFGS